MKPAVKDFYIWCLKFQVPVPLVVPPLKNTQYWKAMFQFMMDNNI